MTQIQSPKSCPSFPHPCAASSPANVLWAGPGSCALLPLAAVKGRAGEEIHGYAGKGRGRRAGAEGHHWVSQGLLEMMLSRHEHTVRRRHVLS